MSSGYATGEYRLRRQAAGRGAYAHVRVVETAPGSSEPADRVHWAVDPADSASAQPARDPAAVQAALDGVADALADLDRIGVDTHGWPVHISFVGINIVDTEPSAVRASAAAATVAAFRAAHRFELIFAGEWRYRPLDEAGAPEDPGVTMSESWMRVAEGRSREEMNRRFVAWKEAAGSSPTDEELRVSWGRHADGGDYWEVLYRPPTGESDR